MHELSGVDFGLVVRARRIASGLSQRDLAAAASIGLRTLRELERGRVHRPHSQSRARLIEVLGTDAPRDDAGTRTSIDILGRLLVRRGEQTMDTGSPRQRCLLALLALHQGNPVSNEEIVEVVWDGLPPTSYAKILHSYVTRLRRLLLVTTGDTTVIAKDAGGYLLTPRAADVDATDFRELIARAAMAGTHDRCTLLAQALDLFRGRVFQNVHPNLAAHPEVVGLNRKRTAGAIAYADLALDAGNPDDVVDRLSAVCADEPFDEALHARLIKALAATGRRAQALSVFSDLKTRLNEHLGVGPDEQLRDLHLHLLRDNAATSLSAFPLHRPTRPVLPPAPHFAARSNDLNVLSGLDERQNRFRVALVGAAGMGKTALALHWAHHVARSFPDGQAIIELRAHHATHPPVTAAAATRSALAAFGLVTTSCSDVDVLTDLLHAQLASKRVMLVLDDVNDSTQLEPILSASPETALLVTSRRWLPGLARHGFHQLPVNPLSHHDSVLVLRELLGAPAHNGLAIDRIAHHCGGMALALHIAAVRLHGSTTLTIEDLAAELNNPTTRLDALDAGEPSVSLRGALECSMRQLDADTAATFVELSTQHPAGISARQLARAVNRDPIEVRKHLHTLANHHLLTSEPDGTYRTHPLIRLYAAELTSVCVR